jgi:hypothetical protein
MVVTGVRSSCDASATKRRRRASLAARSANAPSMVVSITLSASPSSRASVPSASAGTRCERSPAAIAPAVLVMRLSGRTPSRNTQNPTSARIPVTNAMAATSSHRSLVMVASTSFSDNPTTSTAVGRRSASTRYRPEPELLATVNALSVRAAASACATLTSGTPASSPATLGRRSTRVWPAAMRSAYTAVGAANVVPMATSGGGSCAPACTSC